jgi:hypothetical protein
VLYHYTDRRGLLGIVETGEIWASDARYLNDAQELSTAIATAKAVVDAQKASANADERRALEQIAGFLGGMEPPGLGPNLSVFVFSCSEDGDQLSQWRAYARPGDGYAIGFSTHNLVTATNRLGFNLVRCEYTHERHGELVLKCWEDARERLRQATPAVGPEKATLAAVGIFIAGFYFVAPILKHQKFSEEREWRLVRPTGWVGEPGAKFRDGGNLLVPYLPVSIKDPALPILHVYVGPTPHQMLEGRALIALLAQKGVSSGEVRSSQIPYRDW